MAIMMMKKVWKRKAIYILSTLLFCIGLVGCGVRKDVADETKGTKEGNESVQIVGNGKVVIKAEHEDGAYVAEKVNFSIPQNAGYLQSVTQNGTLWGVDTEGNLWVTDADGKRRKLASDDMASGEEDKSPAGSNGDKAAAGTDDVGNMSKDDAALLKMLESREAWDFSDVRSIFLWQGSFYVTRITKEDELEVWSPSGEQLGKLDGKGSSFDEVAGGFYALLRTGEMGSHLSIGKLDAEKRELGAELSQLPNDVRGIFAQGSDAENLYFYTSEAAYRYSYADQVFYQLFPWTDVGLYGSSLFMIWMDGQGDIYAKGYEDPSYVRIRWKSEEELPKKNELTVAIVSMNSDGNLQKLVTEYNQSQDVWHVSIKAYASDAGDFEDAMTRMSADLLSNNPPDLICHANLNRLSEDLASQGYLADLRTFLQDSSALSEEDFYPEILQYGSCGDLLYTIPYQFQMETLLVPASQWKGEPGWTYHEMIQYLHDHEEYRPFRMFFLFRMYCLYRDPLDYFWDAEKKEAYFDSEEFRELLQYMKECQDKEAQASTEDRPFNIELFDSYFLGSYPRERQERGELVVMGYPSPDGKPRTVITGITELSIAATSKKQEGAWTFLEFCLSQDPVKPGYVASQFWSNRNVNEKIIERELALCGQDHEDVLDENGEVLHTMYSEHLVDQESVDAFREMLANARKAPAGNAQVIQIVGEESMAYFENQKSLEQVIDAIQSRVKLMLAE